MLPGPGFLRATVLAVSVAAAVGCGGPMERDAETTTSTPAASSVPDTARIACDAEGARVLTPRVRARRDGVHLHFENEEGRPLDAAIESDRAGGQGETVPPAGTETVVSLPPGTLAVSCTDPASGDDPSEAKRARLEVVDPLALWTASTLGDTCKTSVAMNLDYAEDAKGDDGPAVAAARRYLEQRGVLQPDDVVEAAGYPDQADQVVRLARHGETVAVLEFHSDGRQGLLLGLVQACTGIGFG